MDKNTALQWLIYKSASILLITAFSYVLYDVIYGSSLNEVKSLIAHGNVMKFQHQSAACVGGIPIFIYFILFSFRVLFSERIKPSRKQSTLGKIWGVFSAISFCIGITFAFLVPILLMFSPYSNCPQEKLGAYYVTDLELCKTIDPKNWKIEKKQ